MDDTAQARVRRLVGWIKRNRRDLLSNQGDPAPSALATATGRAHSYWSDVLRLAHTSFGDRAARTVEDALGIPHLYLEGAGWPFEEVAQERFELLTPRQKGRVEKAMLDEIARIESERGSVQDPNSPALSPPMFEERRRTVRRAEDRRSKAA